VQLYKEHKKGKLYKQEKEARKLKNNISPGGRSTNILPGMIKWAKQSFNMLEKEQIGSIFNFSLQPSNILAWITCYTTLQLSSDRESIR